MKKILLSLSLALLLSACGNDATKIIPATYSELDGWQEDSHAAAFKVFSDSCAVNAGKPRAYRAKEEGPVGVRENWTRVCNIAAQEPQPSDSVARKFFETNFSPYKVETESKSTGTMTGYYEPLLKGSRTKQAPYLTPVYGVPSDLGSRKPYYTREEIEAGALKGKAPVLLYVEDPVMLFFLHIQGSGKVQLPDGSLVGLQYAAQNGHQFVPIGRLLKDMGAVSELSMQSIRDWLHANPDQRNEIMNTNPSFIFFKLSPGTEMAKGAQGIPLTPLRSIAVDDDRAAYGVPTYLDGMMTSYGTKSQVPLKRLFISQDTGGALKGPGRADIFFGRGVEEEWQAGHQNAQGKVYWLLPVAEGVHLLDGIEMKPENMPLESEKAEPDDMPPAEQAPVPVVSPDLATITPDSEAPAQ